MSDDSIRQEFLVELDAILESDEAYGSNIQVLTYSVKDEIVSGKFRDSWNNRVYEFIIDIDGISYKPAAKLDSFSEDELPERFDAYSEGYGSLFEDARSDGKLTGKRVKKPKCGTEGYGCGYSCIGLLKTCRILSAGKKAGTNQGKAIGQQRLNKLIMLAEKLYIAGDKKGATLASATATNIQNIRTKYTGGGQASISERALAKQKEQQVKAETKPKEKQPAKPKPEPTKPTSDPTTNPKTHSIKTQREFEDVFYHVVDKLGGDEVRIAKVREAIGELVPRNKFNQYLRDLQGDDDILLHAGSTQKIDDKKELENAISTRVNGLRMLIKLKEKGKNKLAALDKEKKTQIERQLKDRPDLDLLGSARQYTKGAKITTQKDFEEVATKVIQALSDEFNYDDLVPITKVRETLKERVSPENFDKMMVELQSTDKYQLMGHGSTEGQEVPKDLAEGAVITKVNGARHYIKKLK